MTTSSNHPDLDTLLEHSGWVRSLARQLVSDAATAEDLEQRTWLAAIERPPTHSSNPRAWLGKVVRNFAGMHWRETNARRRREKIVGDQRWQREAYGEAVAPPGQLAERMETFGKLADAMVNLPSPYGPAIFLRFFEELSIQEIASRTGATKPEVKARIERGLALLRLQLKSTVGKDWAVKCGALTFPLAGASIPILTSALTMTLKVKVFLAASSIALVALLGMNLWNSNNGQKNTPPPSSESVALASRKPALQKEDSKPQQIARAAIPSASPQPSELLLDPNLDLSGIVVNHKGAPLALAKIEIFKPLHRSSTRVRPFSEPVLNRVAELTSDSEGRFRVPLEAGRLFDLTITAAGYGSKRLPNLYAGEFLRIQMSEAASIRGVVTDAVSGAGIPNARVVATPGVLSQLGLGNYETKTDDNGAYSLSNLPSGYQTLAVFANGFVFDFAAASFVLQPGQEIHHDVALEKGAHIWGRITDANTKQPIAGAVVRTRLWSVDQSVVTDAEGKYDLHGIDPATRERIYVTAPGYGRYDWTVTSLIPEAGLEANLGLLPGRTAYGRLVDSGGTPIAGAFVSANLRYTRPIYLDTQVDYLYTRTNQDGTFYFEDLRIDLRHSLLVAAEGFGSEVFDFPKSEWDSTNLDLGDIVLHKASSISGVVVDLSGEPVPNLWVTLSGESTRRDMLGPVLEGGAGYSSEPGFGMGTTRVPTDELGRYSICDLPAGDFHLWAGAKGYARGAEGSLSLMAGQDVKDFNLVMDAGYSIRGVVVDDRGQPIAGASVSATLRGPFQSRTAYNLSALDGSFFLSGLDPVEYTLRCDEGFQRSVDTHGQRRRFAEIVVKKVVGGTDGVRVVLPSAVLTSGIIIGPDQTPVPGVVVYEKTTQGSEPATTFLSWLATTDEQGKFSIWVEENTSKSFFAYPSLHNPVNQFGVMQFDKDGKRDNSFEVAISILAGATDFLIELPKVPAKK